MIFIKIQGIIKILNFNANNLIIQKGIFLELNGNFLNSINFTNFRCDNSIINYFIDAKFIKKIFFSYFSFYNVQSSF